MSENGTDLKKDIPEDCLSEKDLLDFRKSCRDLDIADGTLKTIQGQMQVLRARLSFDYKLEPQDFIDFKTGKITRKEK